MSFRVNYHGRKYKARFADYEKGLNPLTLEQVLVISGGVEEEILG